MGKQTWPVTGWSRKAKESFIARLGSNWNNIQNGVQSIHTRGG